jgi:hypothetical protein
MHAQPIRAQPASSPPSQVVPSFATDDCAAIANAKRSGSIGGATIAAPTDDGASSGIVPFSISCSVHDSITAAAVAMSCTALATTLITIRHPQMKLFAATFELNTHRRASFDRRGRHTVGGESLGHALHEHWIANRHRGRLALGSRRCRRSDEERQRENADSMEPHQGST